MNKKEFEKTPVIRIFKNFPAKAAGISLFVVLFLAVLRPFSLKLETFWHLYIYLGLGAVVFSLLHVNHYIIHPFLKKFPITGRYGKGNNLVFRVWFFTSMIVAIYFYLLVFADAGDGKYFNPLLVVKIISAGIIPFFIFILVNQRAELKREVFELRANTPLPENENSILLQSENGKEQLQLNLADILFIRAENNYVAVVHCAGEKVKEVLLRSTTAALEQKLKNKGIARCHRSYLVNIAKVIHFYRRAQKNMLELKGYKDKIPVSRAYVKPLRERIAQLGN